MKGVVLSPPTDLGHVGAGHHHSDQLHQSQQDPENSVDREEWHDVISHHLIEDLQAAVLPDAEVLSSSKSGSSSDFPPATALLPSVCVTAGVRHVVPVFQLVGPGGVPGPVLSTSTTSQLTLHGVPLGLHSLVRAVGVHELGEKVCITAVTYPGRKYQNYISALRPSVIVV